MKFKEFLKNAKDYLDNSKLRQWIDGEDSNKGLEGLVIKQSENEVERFLAQVSRTIANLMQMKKFIIPNGKVYLPDRYIVFLSPLKDKEFQGRMRDLFVEGLQFLSEEAATEIVGKTSINKTPIKVELRVDGTLMNNSAEYRVHIYDSKKGTTEIFESQSQIEDDDETIVQIEDDKTVFDSEATTVDNSNSVAESNLLYYLEILFNNDFQDQIAVYKREIKIGRPSKTSEVDVKLSNDKISRHHATMTLDDNGNIWVTHHGQNPTKINGINCNFEEKRLVKPQQKIEIEGFVLIVKK